MHCHIYFEISILNGYITGSVSSDPDVNNPEKQTFPKPVRKEARHASCDLSFGEKSKQTNKQSKTKQINNCLQKGFLIFSTEIWSLDMIFHIGTKYHCVKRQKDNFISLKSAVTLLSSHMEGCLIWKTVCLNKKNYW